MLILETLKRLYERATAPLLEPTPNPNMPYSRKPEAPGFASGWLFTDEQKASMRRLLRLK